MKKIRVWHVLLFLTLAFGVPPLAMVLSWIAFGTDIHQDLYGRIVGGIIVALWLLVATYMASDNCK